MRRQLTVVFAAISLMIALAFAVPLAVLVRSTAEDRALDAARADAAAVVPALVSDGTRSQVESAMGATRAGREQRMTIVTATEWTIGVDIEPSDRLAAALDSGASSLGPVPGGVEIVTAVASGPGEMSVVRVFVGDDELRQGIGRAWASLAFVTLALVAIAVVVADRLARSIVRPTQELARAAHRLGEGHLEARVEPGGPPELVELAGSFNGLGARVSNMLARERELVADLSHRLRTPLTKLGLRIDQVGDEHLAAELRDDVADVTLVVNTLIAEARSTLSPRPGITSDATEIVAERVAFWKVLADDQGRELQFEEPERSHLVGVAAADLVATVDVLIENVFAHTEDGTAFAVGVARAGRSVRIWVEDAGDGFEGSAMQRGLSENGSTGLGLDIAGATARAAGGAIDVRRSRLGGGEVSLLLPIVDSANT